MRPQGALLAVCLVVGSAIQGQDHSAPEPRSAFVVGGTALYGGRVQFQHLSGPYDLMGGRNTIGFGVSAGYRQRVGAGRTSLGFGLEYQRLPFTFTWDINALEVYGIDYPSREETYQAEMMGLGVGWLRIERELDRSSNPFILRAGLGAGWSQLDFFYPAFGAYSLADGNDPPVRYELYRLTAKHRNGWVPLVRLGIGKEWRFNNLNRLGLHTFVQWSPVDDFNSGTYRAYRDTPYESRGTWKQGLNYVGLNMDYAMSFGPGKEPRHREVKSVTPKTATWANNAFGISGGRFWMLPPSSTLVSGPLRELNIVGFVQWNMGLSYERYTNKGWSYGALADVTQPFFSIEAQVDDPAHGNPPGSSTARVEGKTRFVPEFYYWECMAFAGIPMRVKDKWRLDAAVEAGINPRYNTGLYNGFGYSASTDTGRVGVFTGYLGAGVDIWPMFGLRLNGSYRLANHDRLTLTLEARMTPSDFWEGGYNMYGLTDQRSEGTFSGKLAYIGFRVGYAFTWGGPRKPKWLRQQEEAEKAIGPPAR